MLAAIIPYTLQYLLSPVVFLLTFICLLYFTLLVRIYVWFSILLAVTVEVIINWVNFCYYESRGLMILFTFVQICRDGNSHIDIKGDRFQGRRIAS